MLINLAPEYGINYAAGYIGFSYRIGNPLSHGITWIDHRGFKGKIDLSSQFSHVFIVSGKDSIFDSSWKEGVKQRRLLPWLEDPFMRVVFRKLKRLDALSATPLLEAAKVYADAGYEYDKRIFLGMAIIHSTLGKMLPDKLRTKILNVFDIETAFVCSSYATRCTIDGGYSVLQDHRLTPRELFNSDMFKPLKANGEAPKGRLILD